jgi:hypothetical protein
MIYYQVAICRPGYPRKKGSAPEEFEPVLIQKVPADGFSSLHPGRPKIGKQEIDDLFADHARKESSSALTRALLRDLQRYIKHRHYRGTVFVSIPTQYSHETNLIGQYFKEKLKLAIDFSTGPTSQPIRPEALRKIKQADYFLGVWYPDGKNSHISVWLPYEYGAGEALGKLPQLVVEEGVSLDFVGRVDAEMNWPKFRRGYIETILPQLEMLCREHWPLESDIAIHVDD